MTDGPDVTDELPEVTHGLARIVRTVDPDRLADSISGWSQHYEQYRPGRFEGNLSELRMDGAQLFLEQTSLALLQRCRVPHRWIWFGLPDCREREVHINGAAVRPGSIALHRGGVDFDLLTPDQLQFWGIVVEEGRLLDHARLSECDDWLAAMLDRPVLHVSDGALRRVQQACARLLLLAGQTSEITAASLAQASLTEAAFDALFQLFAEARPVQTARVSSRHRHRLVARADAYVRDNGDRLVPISELCNALGVSRRALQNGFHEVTGIGPHAYIRAISLNSVRSHLKNADSPHATVQDAAAAHGFWHMSQFAADYRRQFGELPSQTWARRSANKRKAVDAAG